ncbi:MAG: RagB/SusD family nutrient uptake outer membrane protein [Bacteroidota bacterium]
MKKFNIISFLAMIIITIFIIGISGCKKDFLKVQPKGVISDNLLKNANGAELLTTAAYASLGNGNEYSHITDWIWGSIRSDDAYTGGASTGDQPQLIQYERFAFITVDQSYTNNIWIQAYEAIIRTNKALAVINDLSETEYPLKVQRQAEVRFLRAHNYFLLAKLFKNFPWIDETTPIENYKNISNREYTQDQLYDKIAEDFQIGVDVLPESQTQKGRASKVAAAAYLAKTRLYQAYEQDELHNVTNINKTKLSEVVTLIDYVIGTAKHKLSNDFAENFIYEYENGPESVFAIQFSVDDGTPLGRMDFSHNLNYNMSPKYGCCWFHIPSQNLVNAFKTDANGLPMYESFNDTEMKDPIDFWTNNVDPRLDHSIGIPTHPFKYDPNFIYTTKWARAPGVYGANSSMKEVELYSSPGLRRDGSRFISARNWDIIRYDDVLLMKAEALIELRRQDEALPIINQIRSRAAKSTERLKYPNGTYASNYRCNTYQDGVNCSWTQDFARKALRWERRLEFALESPRFFDLVRWGIAAETLNSYFTTESTRRGYLKDAYFKKNRNEYLPIPQQQIDLSEGLYQQNPGY